MCIFLSTNIMFINSGNSDEFIIEAFYRDDC